MIRLALRQFRTEAIIVVVVLIGLAIVLAVTGGHLVSVNDTAGSRGERKKLAELLARTP